MYTETPEMTANHPGRGDTWYSVKRPTIPNLNIRKSLTIWTWTND